MLPNLATYKTAFITGVLIPIGYLVLGGLGIFDLFKNNDFLMFLFLIIFVYIYIIYVLGTEFLILRLPTIEEMVEISTLMCARFVMFMVGLLISGTLYYFADYVLKQF